MTNPAEDFEDLYENAPFGYLTMRPDGQILSVNATLVTWVGRAREHLIGKRFLELLTVGTRILYETNYAPLLSMQGSLDEISVDLQTASGQKIAALASATVRNGAKDEGAVVRLAFIKAAQRRRYERELVDAHENSRKLEKVTQALLEKEREGSNLREQFIAVLGHDLRNPLASISGGLRLLKKDQPAEKRKLLLEMLDGSVVRMSILIDNVLDFARGRLGGGIPLAIAPGVLLTPVLEQVVAELRLGVPDRTIETSFDTPNPIRCDPSRLGQLVSNLLGNALTHGAPDVPVRIHAAANAEGLTIWVANGGEPISPEAIERLFQPFFRGEVRPSQQGLGLGLHIASEIAKAHGGRLNVVSTAAETRFTFQMPAPAG